MSSEDRFRFWKPGTHTSNQPQVLLTLTPSCLPPTSFPSSCRLAMVVLGIVSWSQGQGLVSHQQPSVSDRSWQVAERPVEGRAVVTAQNHPSPHQLHCPMRCFLPSPTAGGVCGPWGWACEMSGTAQRTCVLVTWPGSVQALLHRAGPLRLTSLNLWAHGKLSVYRHRHHGGSDGGCPSWALVGLWSDIHSLSQ